MNTKIDPKYFFFACLFTAMALTVVIFWPFLTVFVLGAAVAVVFYPLYQSLNKMLPWQTGWLSACITVLCFIVIICGPLAILGTIIVDQSAALYQKITMEGGSGYTLISDTLAHYLPDSLLVTAQAKLANLAEVVSAHLGGIFTATVNTIFSFLLLVLAVFYFLKDGARWKRAIIMLSPLHDHDDEKIIKRLRDAVNGVVRGYLLIGLAQGVLTGVGLYLFHVPNPALLGVIAGIASLIPSIGTALVSVPIIVYLFATGNTNAALGYAVWAGVLVGTVDNILNPILVGRQIRIPPLLILFSVLGGIAFMGPVGILVGPLVISLLFALLSIYRAEFRP